jgi:hypothetical protein
MPRSDKPEHARLTRRAFLQLMGAAGVTALAGCSPKLGPTPTPTKTPASLAQSPPATGTPQPSPTLTARPTATASGTATATASATATAKASATPSPTVTPTPTASPFPPGPPSKLGLFVTRNDPRIFDLLRTGNVTLVKTMEYDPNFVTEIKQISPATDIVARIDLPQLDLSNLTDPAAMARAFADQLLPIATEPRRLAAITAWEAYNEPAPGDPEQMSRLAAFEAERVRLLAAAGIKSVIGNFSTGAPPLEWWPQFRPALEAAKRHGGYLGLHEYSAPTMQFGTPQDPLGWGSDPAQEGWLTLRYRKVYRQYLQPNNLVIPLFITELGIDGYVRNRPGPQGMGWRDFGAYWDGLGMGIDAGGNYVEQLAWYDAQMQQDPYVLGAAIFAAAASPGWESYEILDEAFNFLHQYLSVHPPR